MGATAATDENERAEAIPTISMEEDIPAISSEVKLALAFLGHSAEGISVRSGNYFKNTDVWHYETADQSEFDIDKKLDRSLNTLVLNLSNQVLMVSLF